MEKRVKVTDIIRGLKTDPFVLNCNMAMGYVAGLPILHIRNQELCMTIPFLKYRVTGFVDKTQVYPIRYTVTMVLPERQFVEFKNLAYQPGFGESDFTKPVGLFRHEAVKNLTKQEYMQAREELMGLYDKVIGVLLYDEDYNAQDEKRMRQLMQMMIEPSLLPAYKALDEDFYNKYFL